VSVQAFSNGVLAAPLQFWSANKPAIIAALGTITNEADFIAWLATNTFDVRISNLEEATDALNTRVGVLEGN
jgi:hypothetical protein